MSGSGSYRSGNILEHWRKSAWRVLRVVPSRRYGAKRGSAIRETGASILKSVPLALAPLAAIIVAGASCGSTAATRPVTKLFPKLAGTRTPTGELIIDESRGRFAGLRLGMSMAAAEKTLPHANFSSSFHPAEDASYCSAPASGGNCGSGVILDIFDGCEIGLENAASCFTANPFGPLTEIDILSQGNPLGNRESQQAVTLRGISLGSPAVAVAREYRFTDKTTGLCNNDGGARFPGTTYTILSGKNTTLLITMGGGIVKEISLVAGRHPQICS